MNQHSAVLEISKLVNILFCDCT